VIKGPPPASVSDSMGAPGNRGNLKKPSRGLKVSGGGWTEEMGVTLVLWEMVRKEGCGGRSGRV